MGWSKPGKLLTRKPTHSINTLNKDWKWRKFSEAFRKQPENALCADCGAIAQEVHHKIKRSDAPSLTYSYANCVALCRVCHQKRTARGE